jgi:hypothetical protein
MTMRWMDIMKEITDIAVSEAGDFDALNRIDTLTHALRDAVKDHTGGDLKARKAIEGSERLDELDDIFAEAEEIEPLSDRLSGWVAGNRYGDADCPRSANDRYFSPPKEWTVRFSEKRSNAAMQPFAI